MQHRTGVRTGPPAITHLVEVGPASGNGAVWDLAAGDRLSLRLANPGKTPAAASASARPGVEAELPDGRCVGRLAPEAAARVAPLLAAGRQLAAAVTALVPRPMGGPPRVQLAIVRRHRVA